MALLQGRRIGYMDAFVISVSAFPPEAVPCLAQGGGDYNTSDEITLKFQTQ